MGIKGIYRELGPGQRISLGKLATENLERTGKPLRIAIDIAIWQFQTQAAKGGTNPAIRTLFYRLVRLLGLSVQPIFVFDGPNKPAFKRNKRAGRGDGIASAMAKRLIHLFGFPIHLAPGEAEAECALLQQQGLVDAVLSEDVDTIMFGCNRTFRNWTAEGTRAGKSPTHVTVYDINEPSMLASGLDREGMVLVALMSGGDYLPEGVPGCGVKLACEVARAGFGKTLCNLKAADKAGMAEWRATLVDELRTNKSNFFRTKHKALIIPDNFPDIKILRYYTHPAVSSKDDIKNLGDSVKWSRPVDVIGLRHFVEEVFDWTCRIGAVKLIRVLSPSLLVQTLLERHNRSTQDPQDHDLECIEHDELAVVQRITAKRNHFSMDGIPELRISHVPSDIVPLDLSQERDEIVDTGRQGLALNSDDEYEATLPASSVLDINDQVLKKVFDPTIPQPMWLPETLVKLGVPLCVQDWEEKQRAKNVPSGKAKSVRKKRPAGNPAAKTNPLDQWVISTKPVAQEQPEKHNAPVSILRQESRFKSPQPLPPIMASPRTSRLQESTTAQPRKSPHRTLTSLPRSKPFTSKSAGKATITGTTQLANPWAFSDSQRTPRTTKPGRQPEAIIIMSSPESSKGLPIPLAVGTDHEYGAVSNAERCAAQKFNLSSSEKILAKVRCDKAPAPSATGGKRQIMTIDLTQTSLTSFVGKLPATNSTTSAVRSSMPPEVDRVGKECYSVDTTPPSTSSEQSLSSLLDRIDLSSPSDRHDYPSPKTGLSPTPHGSQAGRRGGSGASVSAAPKITKIIVPRVGTCGFFKEVELSDNEAAQLMTTDVDHKIERRQKTKTMHRAWRQSQVAVIDLTGED